MRILKCEICGNVVEVINDCGTLISCCGQDMVEMVPCTSDGDHEKHIPVITVSGHRVLVTVGETAHPMTDSHFIEWIALKTTRGLHRIDLNSTQKPWVEFMMSDTEKPVAAYAYCNIHGLWKTDV